MNVPDPGDPAASAAQSLPASRRQGADLLLLLARLVVGAGFVYLGWAKVVDPVGFLKLIRQYEVTSTPLVLNSAAVILPWVEVCCGGLLLAGVTVRGAALVSFSMLLPFTLLVLRRALQLAAAGHVPFCLIKFDCGCGAGEVFICHKLVENSVLMILSALLVWRGGGRWGLGFFRTPGSGPPAGR